MNLTSDASPGKSQTSQAFERLRADIVSGELSPGNRLKIHTLSSQYDFGATAIREALSRLVSDGFVELEDQRGFCVMPVSPEELVDLTRTRIELESMALSHAIAKGGIEWESGILSSFHRLSRTPIPSSPELHVVWEAAHSQFHGALLEGCGSPWTMRLFRLLYEKSERYRNLAERHTSEKNRDPSSEHRQLMEAVMDRDNEQACALLSDHYWKTTNIVLDLVFTRNKSLDSGARPRSRKNSKEK